MQKTKNSQPNIVTAKTSGLIYSLAMMCVIVFSLLFSVIIQLIANKQYGGTSAATEALKKNTAYIFASFSVTGIVILIFTFIFDKVSGFGVRSAFRIKKPLKRYWLVSLAAFIGMFLGLSFLNEYFIKFLVKYAGYVYTDTVMPSYSVFNLIMCVITVCLIPAVAEEFLFRGIMLRGVENCKTWLVCLIGGLLFSVYHMNPAQTPYQFAVGFLFTMIALKSGSVFPTMVMHFLNNLIIVLCYYFAPHAFDFTGAPKIILTVIGLLLTAAAIIYSFVFDKNKTINKDKIKDFAVYSVFGALACAVLWAAGLLL